MRYSQVRAFHHVALHGGFSRAADALGLSQPAVSEHVRKLEIDHDTLLFNRDRKQIALTPAGEKLFLLTRQFFEVEDNIDDLLTASRAVPDGTLRIIADSAFHITDRITRFRKKYPNVSMSVHTGNTVQILSALRTYNAEIGVVGSLEPGSDMEIISLGSSPITAFAARDFGPHIPTSLTLRDLVNYPLVLREKGSKTRQALEEAAARLGITLDPAAEVEGREAVREMVAAGVGIGFVSAAEFGVDTRLVKLPLETDSLRMSESLVYLKQRADLRVIRAFITV